MDFFKLVSDAKCYFPELKIKYKDESSFMKFLGKILFFNKKFMTYYTTTIGNTVYFPSKDDVENRPLSSSTILMHELMHVQDRQKLGFLFNILYLFPQILSPIFGLIFLFFSWKLSLLFFLLFLLPFPAYFRMNFEKRAYLVSLYVIKALSLKYGFASMLKSNKDNFLKEFKSSTYYYMWIFKDIEKEFEDKTYGIAYGKRPFDDKIFDILDDLISKN